MDPGTQSQQPTHKVSKNLETPDLTAENSSGAFKWIMFYVVAIPLCIFLGLFTSIQIMIFYNSLFSYVGYDPLVLLTPICILLYISIAIILIEKKRTNSLGNKNQQKNSKWNRLSLLSVIVLLLWFIQLPLTLPELPRLTAGGNLTILNASFLVSLLFLPFAFFCGAYSYSQIQNTNERGGKISILVIVLSGICIFIVLLIAFIWYFARDLVG